MLEKVAPKTFTRTSPCGVHCWPGASNMMEQPPLPIIHTSALLMQTAVSKATSVTRLILPQVHPHRVRDSQSFFLPADFPELQLGKFIHIKIAIQGLLEQIVAVDRGLEKMSRTRNIGTSQAKVMPCTKTPESKQGNI